MSDYEILYNRLKDSKNIKLKDVNKAEIEDIKNIKINQDLEPQERILDFLKKVKNPYIFKVNDTLVKVNYNNIDGNEFKYYLNNIIKANCN